MSERHFMNPRHGKLIGRLEQEGKGKGSATAHEKSDVHEEGSQEKAPNIHIDSHENGHTVHIHHHDGREDEKHEHESGDAEGIAAHIHEHLGGKEGQDHGYSSGEEMENEESYGGPGV